MEEVVVDFSGFYEEYYEIRDNPCPGGLCHDEYCLITEEEETHGWVLCVRVKKYSNDIAGNCDACQRMAEYIVRVYGETRQSDWYCQKHTEEYVQNMTKVSD